MVHTLIASPDEAAPLRDALAGADRLALDCEAAGFHRYSDRLCLVQLTVGDQHYVVDPLAFEIADLLRPPLEDPDVRILMHGSDYDLRLLDRDLSIRPTSLFDTQVAASLLGESSLGLSALLEKHLDVKLSKKFQRADWAKRPLPEGMLQYAVLDTAYLHTLVDLLAEALERAGRQAWADEEFSLLEQIGWEDDGPVDPIARVKKARRLPVRQVARMRALLEWRDEVAREMDRAPFRVADDRILLHLADDPPREVEALRELKGFSTSLAESRGSEVLERLAAIDAQPEDALVPFPRSATRGPGRPPPEIEERFERLKVFRNRKADELGIARGTLFPNASLLEIATRNPDTLEALTQIPVLKRWQLEVAADGLLRALQP